MLCSLFGTTFFFVSGICLMIMFENFTAGRAKTS